MGPPKLHQGRRHWGRRETELGTHPYISILALGSEGRTTELCSLQSPVVVEQGDLGRDLSVTCLHRLGN